MFPNLKNMLKVLKWGLIISKDVVMNSFTYRKLLLLLSVLLTLSLAVTGCGNGNDDPSPTTSAPPTTYTPTGPLTFPQGKYEHYEVFNDLFAVATSNDEAIISVGIKARTTGWVAIALSNSLQKAGADLWMGYVDAQGAVTVIDSFNPGYSGSHPPDSAYGGTDDLYDITGSESNGVTTIEFKRHIQTNDSYDVPILNGLNAFIWAVGPSDNTFEEHSLLGYGDITADISHS